MLEVQRQQRRPSAQYVCSCMELCIQTLWSGCYRKKPADHTWNCVWNLRVIMIYRHPFYCPVGVGTAFWPMIRLFRPTEGRFCAEVVSQGYKNLPLIDFRKCLSCSSLNNISAPWQHLQRVPNLPKNYKKISISLRTWKNSLKPCGLAFRSPCIPHWHSLSSFVPSLN